MSNIVFELFAKLGLDSSEYEKGLNNAKGLAGTIGGGIKTAFGIGTKAIGAATAAVGAFGLASVKGYAEYEQLVGGVSKLYGTAGQEIEEFAESQGKTVDEVREKYNQLKEAERLMAQQSSEAYKTAGMSANEYMETATSFSAALINSLSGNTVEAAKMTDVAMKAISDNVNTFGSDMGSVTNAFQGFAKQNYTMLDNLKLGYGGTKSEMERLIADANEYRATIGETANLSIDSFADVVQAIQSVQEKQQIAGTTTKEAMKTIEGSATATKAAWQNVITAIAGGGDLKAAFNQLTTSIFGEKEDEGFLSQIIPRIETTMDGIGTFIENSAPYITEKLPALLDSILPSALQGGIQLIGAIGQGIINSLPTIVDSAAQIVVSLTQGLVQSLPELAKGAITLIQSLAQSFSESKDSLLQVGADLLTMLWDGITTGLPMLVEGAVEIMSKLGEGLGNAIPELLPVALNAIMEFSGSLRKNAGVLVDSGLEMIMNIVDGLIQALPSMIETIPTIVTNIAGIINDNAPKLIATGIELIGKLIAGIIQAIPTLIAEFPKIIQAIFAVITAVNWINLGATIINGIVNGVKGLAANLPNLLRDTGTKGLNFLKSIQWNNLGSQIINFIVNGVRSMASSIPSVLRSIGLSALNVFKSINWLSLGTNVIAGIVSGITGGIGSIIDAVKDAAGAIWDSITGFFDIHSPSRKMAWIGEMIDKGLAKGINDNDDMVDDAINKITDIGAISTEASLNLSGGNSANNGTSVIMYIYGAVGQDVNELADIVSRRINDVTNRRMMAMGAATT